MFRNMNSILKGSEILQLLVSDFNKEFHVRDIAKRTNISVGKTSETLKDLLKANLVQKREIGNMKFYKANIQSPELTQFKILMNVSALNRLVASISKLCDKIILFGSCAKGTDTPESDIDLLIITDNVKEVKEKTYDMPDLNVSPHIMTIHEYLKLKKRNPGFVKKIREGIVLWKKEA